MSTSSTYATLPRLSPPFTIHHLLLLPLPLLALAATAARGVPAAFTCDAMPPDARSPRRGAAKNDHQVSRLPLCHTYGLRARARAHTVSLPASPPHLPPPLFRSPQPMPARSFPLYPFSSLPPTSLFRLTPPPRYRYHNNGIIAILAACYTMTLGRDGVDRVHSQTRETGLDVRPDAPLYSRGFFSSEFRRGAFSVSTSVFARESPTTCSIRAAARALPSGPKQAGAEGVLFTNKTPGCFDRKRGEPPAKPARFANRCPVRSHVPGEIDEILR